jgi:hypothetical protein
MKATVKNMAFARSMRSPHARIRRKYGAKAAMLHGASAVFWYF